MKFYIIVANGKKQGMPIPITVDLFLFGTAKSCQLRSKVPGVAAQHCALITKGGKVFLRDLPQNLEILAESKSKICYRRQKS